MRRVRWVVGALAAFHSFCALVLLVIPPKETPPGSDVGYGRCPNRAFEEALSGVPGGCRNRGAERVAKIAELSILATAASFGYLALAVRAPRRDDA